MMRGTVAKRLRRQVYADHVTSPKGRAYQVIGRFLRRFKVTRWNEITGKSEEVERRYEVATVGADEHRRRYRAAKRSWRRARATIAP
jgi:hypothetical protein